MKKLIVLVVGALTIGLGSVPIVAGAQDTAAQASVPKTGSLITETINDIAVPTDVLLYVQTNYQGYAVTQASRVTRDSKQAYSLRVDPNDITTDYDGFYLLYDAGWKHIGEEKMTPPPTPKSDPNPHTNIQKSPSSQPSHPTIKDRKPKKPKHNN